MADYDAVSVASGAGVTLHKITLPSTYKDNWKFSYARKGAVDYVGIVGTAASDNFWFGSFEVNSGTIRHVCELSDTNI